MGKYDLGGDIKGLRVINEFSDLLDKTCMSLGKALRPFCFCANSVQQEKGIIDLATVNGLENPDVTLMTEVAYMRAEVLRKQGVFLPKLTEISKKALFLDYMLTHSICYIEIPKVKTTNGEEKGYYDKFLATKNLRIIQAWTHTDIKEVQYKFKEKLGSDFLGITNGELRVAKLTTKADTGSATMPRFPIDIKNAICVPLYCLNAFQRSLQDNLENGMLEFTFLKDNGTERVIPTTLSRSILMEYYKDFDYVDKTLKKVQFFNKRVDDVVINKYQSRGYVQLPEIGSSIYDQTGNRSINLARVISIKRITEVDRTYIHVNLDTVMGALERNLGMLYTTKPEQLTTLASELSNGQISVDGLTPAQVLENVSAWANSQLLILSTPFRRYLHKFMITHQQWFPNYTGMQAPVSSVSDSTSFGVGSMDF